MKKTAAVLVASCVALASVPSVAAERGHHAGGSTVTKARVHKRHLAAHTSKKRLDEEALWPVYFYGCDDGDGNGITDCD